MKKHIKLAILLFLLAGLILAIFVTIRAVEPRYTGIFNISPTLNISTSGAASCYGAVMVRSGYTADLTVELKQDGTTIKTWTDSGSGSIRVQGTYYVISGHDYVVTTTAIVYDSNNRVIETSSADSAERSY